MAKVKKEFKEELESGVFVGNYHCIANEVEGKDPCSSSDALSCYEKEDSEGNLFYDAYCRSCCQPFSKSEVHTFDDSTPLKQELADILGIAETGVVNKKEKTYKPKSVALTKEQVKSMIKEVGYDCNNYRGISRETCRFFGTLTKLDKKGNVVARYYPETEDYKVTGFACRNHPKDFRYGRVGRTGSKSELFGQYFFRKVTGKYVLLVGGQEDTLAAFQMLLENQQKRYGDEYLPIPVVSPTTGEGSAYKQIAAQYDWLDGFDNIILGFDNDDAGKEATLKALEVLPKDKVKIALWSSKDPNKMLLDGKENQFCRDFFNAKPVVDDGVKSSSTTMNAILDELGTERLTLPPYQHKMQAMMGGGILDCTITNIIAATSTGKTSHVNNDVYHWIFHAPSPPTIVSLEATEGQWGVDLLSIHLEKNLRWMSDNDRLEYLQKPYIMEKCNQLWFNEMGEPRFYLVDERDGDIHKMEKTLEKINKKYGSKIFVIDVLSDALAGTDLDTQQRHMKWQKMFIKNGNRIINILHTRKQPPSKDGKLAPINEYDAAGTGDLVRSAAYNILLERDKESNDNTVRNSTRVRLPKCRGGITGEAGTWYYDFNSRECYDLDDYMEKGTPNKSPRTIEETPVEMKTDDGIVYEEDFGGDE